MTEEELTIYELAFHLHMPVNTLLNDLTYDELLGWFNYLERRPVGWRDDDRTFKLLQAQGVKQKPGELFSSLNSIYASLSRVNEEGTNIGSLRGSMLFQQMMTATGGDKLEL